MQEVKESDRSTPLAAPNASAISGQQLSLSLSGQDRHVVTVPLNLFAVMTVAYEVQQGFDSAVSML